eukprot:scaffold257_cov241-Pinguiococcus_pyrenoidosus.AAC.4
MHGASPRHVRLTHRYCQAAPFGDQARGDERYALTNRPQQGGVQLLVVEGIEIRARVLQSGDDSHHGAVLDLIVRCWVLYDASARRWSQGEDLSVHHGVVHGVDPIAALLGLGNLLGTGHPAHKVEDGRVAGCAAEVGIRAILQQNQDDLDILLQHGLEQGRPLRRREVVHRRPRSQDLANQGRLIQERRKVKAREHPELVQIVKHGLESPCLRILLEDSLRGVSVPQRQRR